MLSGDPEQDAERAWNGYEDLLAIHPLLLAQAARRGLAGIYPGQEFEDLVYLLEKLRNRILDLDLYAFGSQVDRALLEARITASKAMAVDEMFVTRKVLPDAVSLVRGALDMEHDLRVALANSQAVRKYVAAAVIGKNDSGRNCLSSVDPKKVNLQLDALSTEQALRRRLTDFAQSVAYLRDPRISAVCRRLWESDEVTGGLVGQLWVEGIFPSRSSGRNARDLAEEGVLSGTLIAHLEKTRVFPTDRALYLHQEQAIRAEADSVGDERPAVVVTAATGAGKTEAFLLPMLNAIFRERRRPGQAGVRAIILYPMNALVNTRLSGYTSGSSSKIRLRCFTLQARLRRMTPKRKERDILFRALSATNT